MFNSSNKKLNEHDLIYGEQYNQKVSLLFAFFTKQTINIFAILMVFYYYKLNLFFYFKIETITDVVMWTCLFTVLFYRKWLNVKKFKTQTLPVMKYLITLRKKAIRDV